MRYYEFVYIVSPEVDEEDLETVASKVGQMIVDGGGEVVHLESWGRRRLAYPIRRFREGHYVLAHIQMDPEAISGLKDRLGLTEEVIRYLMVRIDSLPAKVEAAASPQEPVETGEAEEEEPEEEPGQEPDEEAVEPEAAAEQDSEETDQEEQGG